MLPLRPNPRWTRLYQAHRHVRRLQTTPLAAESAYPEPLAEIPRRHFTPPKRTTHGVVFIKTEEGVGSMQEAFAIVRGVEKRLGRIRDFQFFRDTDDPSFYRTYCIAELENSHDWQELPSDEPMSIKIQVPRAERNRIGGVSLAGLRRYLLPVEKEPFDPLSETQTAQPEPSEDPSEFYSLQISIEKGDGRLYYKSKREYEHMSRRAAVVTGTEFAKWGGFHNPSDGPSDAAFTAVPMEDRMTKAVASWQVALSNLTTKEQRRTGQSNVLEKAGEVRLDEVVPEVHSLHSEPVSLEEVIDAAPSPLFSSPPTSTAETAPPTSSPITPSPEPIEEPLATPSSAPELPEAPKLTRKERILAQARESARRPPSESSLRSSTIEAEQTGAAKKTVDEQPAPQKDSFWSRLMGKRW